MDRRGSRWLPVVLAGLASLLWLTAVTRAQIRLGANLIGAAAEGEKEAEEVGDTVFRQPERKVLQNLSIARQLLEAGRVSEGVVYLQRILDGPEDYFFQPDKKSVVRLSLKREAERLVGGMPVEGRRVYELFCRDVAPALLRTAVQSGDRPALAEVSRRFFHTEVGYQATFFLGLDHLDHGRPLAAALTLKRLLDNCPDVTRFEPALSLAMAASWVRAGMPDEARRVLAELKRRQRGPTVEIGGQEVALFADEGRALEWLARWTGPQVEAGPDALEQWAMLRGNPSRTALTTGGAPLLNMRWRVPVSGDPVVQQMIEQTTRDFEDQGLPSLPGLHPLAVNDVVLMRTARNLFAIDLVSGKRLWEVQMNDPLESLAGTTASQVSLNETRQLQTGLAQRVWSDATYGTLSSDGQYVFSIEDLGPGLPINGSPHRIINGRRMANPAWPKPYNRLAAHDINTGKLVWELGGGDDEFELPLSGAFFLGPPLPLMGQLYVLAEVKQEVRLYVLRTKKTGRDHVEVVWSQQLAPVEQERNRRNSFGRRLVGVSPSYADGILVCPTSTGAIVAVDLATRSLQWGYPYGQEGDGRRRPWNMAMQMGMRTQSGQADLGKWSETSTILAEGRLLVAPAEENHLHCLRLADGQLDWKMPREDGLYVGCVHDGKAIVVASREVRAYSLHETIEGEEGERTLRPKPAWEGRTVKLPEGAVPSGQGYRNGDRYYLPLSTAEVMAIDLRTGKIQHSARSRQGDVPGNLVCYKGRVISQSPNGVDCFYQLEVLKKVAEDRLAANSEDAEALAFRGEILLDEGKRQEAIGTLRRSLAASSDPRTRDLLRDAMFEGLEADFARHRAMSDEIQTLLDEPEHRATYLRLMAAGYRAEGDLPAALDHYLQLADLDAESRGLEEVSKVYSVRRDRWIQAQLAELRGSAPAEFRSRIDEAVGQRLDKALKAEAGVALRRFLECFGNQPAADEARQALVGYLAKSGHLLEAEMLLRQKERCGDPKRMAAAVAETAQMLRGAGRAEDAAVYYRRLQSELADVVCLDGKTGRELVEALPPESDVVRLMGPPPSWPKGKVIVKTGTPPSGRRSFHGRFVLAYNNSPKPFFEDTKILFDQNRKMLLAVDAMGREKWKPVSILKPGASTNRFFAYNRSFTRASVEGHLLIVSMGYMIQAFDTLGGPSQEGPRLIWSMDLTDSGNSAALTGRIGMGGVNVFQMRHLQMVRHQQSGVRNIGPVTENFVCFQRLRHLTAVDSMTGDVLWTRSDVPPGSDLFGNNQYVFAVPPGGSEAMVIRAIDGTLLGTRELPQSTVAAAEVPDEPADEDDDETVVVPVTFRQHCIATLGRNLLIWRPEGDERRLELFDLWEQKELWPAKSFNANAKFAMIDDEVIGVMEPNGRFMLLSLPDGRTLVDAALQPEPSLSNIYVLRLQDEWFLVANCPKTLGATTRPSQPLPGTLYGAIASARVYGFDAKGKALWPKPVEVQQQQILLSQPSQLPVLTFASQVYTRRANGSGSYQVCLECIDKRTGRKVVDEKFPNSTGIFELYGDPEAKTVEVVTQRNKATLTFTDEPLGPEAAKPKTAKIAPPTIGTAIFKALGKAVGEVSSKEVEKAAEAVGAKKPAEKAAKTPIEAKPMPPAPVQKRVEKPKGGSSE